MTNSIILIGPRQWGQDHLAYFYKNRTTSIQYSAKISDNTKIRLRKMLIDGFRLFIYVPKNYKCKGIPFYGSGTIEFSGDVENCRFSEVKQRSPWNTVDGPKNYDINDDFQYEFWFKMSNFSQCNKKIEDFELELSTGEIKKYDIIGFTRSFRKTIPFAII